MAAYQHLTDGDIQPGRVIWVDLVGALGTEQQDIRPCVVVHAAKYTVHWRAPHTIYIVPISRPARTRHICMIRLVRPDPDQNKPSHALCDQLRAVDLRQRFTDQCRNQLTKWRRRHPHLDSKVTPEELEQIMTCISENLFS